MCIYIISILKLRDYSITTTSIIMTLPDEKNGSRCTKQPNYTKRKSGGSQVVEGIWIVGKGRKCGKGVEIGADAQKAP